MTTPGVEPAGHAGLASGKIGAGAVRAAAAWAAARSVLSFFGDALWWAAGLLGLVTDLTLAGLAPQALAGSVLLGAGPWLSCVLWQPVLEEVVFRGIFQGELQRTRWGERRIWRVTAANGVCSLVFTGIHFVHHPPLWAASVLVPSLVFGWLRERHGTVAAPIAMHVLYNLEFFSAASLVMR